MARTKGKQPLDVNAIQRRNMALELRIRGHSQRQIAQAVGVSQPQVSRMIAKALHEQQAEHVDDLRAIEGERMERLHAAMWKPATEQGNVGAANVIVRASERRSKLLGLDIAKDSDGGGAMRCDYFAHVVVATTDEADRVFAEMEAAIARDKPYMHAETVVDSTVDVSPDVTSMEQAKAVALAQVKASMPTPPLRMKVIILARSYMPVNV